MTDTTRLTPLTMALYGGLQTNLDVAHFVAERLASEWRVPIAVVPGGVVEGLGPLWGFFDLSTMHGEHDETVRLAAEYVANP